MATLTISREYGSGGFEIGRRVAERLGYEFVDKERLFQDMERAGSRWARVAKEVDEVCPTLWERHDWQYRGYVAQMENLILQYALNDNVVIIGRGGSFLLQGVPFCLRVRLVASLEARLEAILARLAGHGLPGQDARLREDPRRNLPGGGDPVGSFGLFRREELPGQRGDAGRHHPGPRLQTF